MRRIAFLLLTPILWTVFCAPGATAAGAEEPAVARSSRPTAVPFSGDQWVSSWTALGPFHHTGGNGLDEDGLGLVGGEEAFLRSGMTRRNLAPLFATTPTLLLQNIAPDAQGFVDFNAAFGDGTELSNTVAYAWADLVCPGAGYALLRAGSDDGIQVWINNRVVLDHPTRRAAAPDQDVVGVRLQKGRNRCLVKVDQGTGDWGFYLRFSRLVEEEPAVHLQMLEPPVLPLILLGAEKPIDQSLHVSLLHNGTEPGTGLHVRLRSPDLAEYASKAFSLEPGEVAHVTLDLSPRTRPPLEPGNTVDLTVELLRPDGSMKLLGSARTATALVHPLLRADSRPGDSSEPFFIVQLSDTHIERRGSVLLDVRTAERLERAVADINTLDPPPAFAVVTGDFTHNSMEAYPVYHEIMSKLNVPFLTVFGNHDKPQGLPAAARAFSEWGQPEYCSFEYNGIPFLILDSVAEANPGYGRISSKQLGWLREVLDPTPATPRVFFLHHDLFSGRGVENYEEVQRVIEQHPGPSWFFTGHWHADAFVRRGEQHHVITSSTGYLFPMETLTQDHGVPGYRIIRIENGRVSTEFKALGGAVLSDPSPSEYWTVEELTKALEKASP